MITRKVIIRRLIYSCLLLLLMLTAGCSLYTAPSPLDGIWLVEQVESSVPFPHDSPDKEPVYWNFSNVLYTVGTVNNTTKGFHQKGWGNVYFERDTIRFVPDDRTTPYFPLPGEDQTTHELKLAYKVWQGKLLLKGDHYTIHLKKQ